MKQSIQVDELKQILTLAKSALEEKGLMDFTGNVIFHNKKLYAGNDKIVVMGPAPFDFDFSVNGTDLMTVLDGGKLLAEFTLKEKVVIIKSGKVKAKLALADIEAPLKWLKESGLDKEVEWKQLPSGFLIGLDWCKFSASKDVSYRPHTCLKVKNDRILSTDTLRLSRFIMEEESDLNCLIPKEAVPIIVGFPGVNQYAMFGKSWLCFRSSKDNMVCGVRLVVGDLPPGAESLFDKEGVEIKLPEGLKEIVKRAGKFVEGIAEESKVIQIVIKDGQIACEGTKSTGFLSQFENLDYEGHDMTFLVVPALFEQVLDKAASILFCGNQLHFKVGQFSHVMVISTEKNKSGNEEE